MSTKSSRLHEAFARLYEERWRAAGGTLMAFAESSGVRRETLRGWLQKDRIELLENLEAGLDSLGAEVVIQTRKQPPIPPVDRRRSTIR
jgi:hypothetical protein